MSDGELQLYSTGKCSCLTQLQLSNRLTRDLGLVQGPVTVLLLFLLLLLHASAHVLDCTEYHVTAG